METAAPSSHSAHSSLLQHVLLLEQARQQTAMLAGTHTHTQQARSKCIKSLLTSMQWFASSSLLFFSDPPTNQCPCTASRHWLRQRGECPVACGRSTSCLAIGHWLVPRAHLCRSPPRPCSNWWSSSSTSTSWRNTTRFTRTHIHSNREK